MSDPIRSPHQTVISVSMTKVLLAQIDERARAVGLSRSQYLCQLARTDLHHGGDLTLRESPTNSKSAESISGAIVAAAVSEVLPGNEAASKPAAAAKPRPIVYPRLTRRKHAK